MAGSEGFEPSDQLSPIDSLANYWFKPLAQLPVWWLDLDSNKDPRIFSPLHRPTLLSSHQEI